jgi:hypothetical protein
MTSPPLAEAEERPKEPDGPGEVDQPQPEEEPPQPDRAPAPKDPIPAEKPEPPVEET